MVCILYATYTLVYIANIFINILQKKAKFIKKKLRRCSFNSENIKPV